MKIVLGDNPFFGVDHRAGSKPLANEKDRFENAADVICCAAKNEIDTMMLSTHPGHERLLSMVDKKIGHRDLKLNLALVMPFPHTLNKQVAEGGYLSLVASIGYWKLLNSCFDFIKTLFFNKNFSSVSLIKNYINLELSNINYSNIQVEYMCLHNIITDIFIATGRFDILNDFISACIEKDIEPVLLTQNPVRLLQLNLKDRYIACFSYNPTGYMVNPSLKSVNSFLNSSAKPINVKLWAMQIFASGVSSLENVGKMNELTLFDGVLYATTKPDRILTFADFVKENFK